MTLKDLTEKARELVPWHRGKRSARGYGLEPSSLPALQKDFGRVFEDLFGRRFGERWLAPLTEPATVLDTDWPHIDLEETDKEFHLTADIPGMNAEDIEVTLGERTLTLRGAKTTTREEHKKDYRMMETYSGSFHRTVPLPAEVDADDVQARCKNGQLTVTLPKTETARASAKKIEVK